MIKLKPLLFESVSPEEFIETFYSTMTGNNPLIGEIPDFEKFYQLNKQVLDRILNNATEFRFLGAGANGAAYSIGNNQVLKIEPSNYRSAAIASMFDKQTKTGLHHPMIYDEGKLNTEYGEGYLGYAILEKMEIPSGQDLYDIGEIIFQIQTMINNKKEIKEPDGAIVYKKYTPKDIQKEKTLTQADKIKTIGKNLVLKNDWLKKLINHMFKIAKEGLHDFHAGNIGIRRIGSSAQGWMPTPGYLVFFD